MNADAKEMGHTMVFRHWLMVVLLLAMATLVQAAESVNELRTQQQVELSKLEGKYHAKVRANPALIKPDGTVDTQHPDYQKVLSDYRQEKSAVQAKYNDRDTRAGDLKQLEKRYGSRVKATGSAPKDVRADVDISANDKRIAKRIADDWSKRGDSVRYDPDLGIYINETRDTTLWAPPTPAQLAKRQNYHDAFSTPGGKAATNVKGKESVRDPEGYVLDNEKKFIHAVEDLNKSEIGSQDPQKQLERETALKTVGKSVSKTAEEVGQNSDVIKQARTLRNYGDKFEAGITPLGASPQQQQADERHWIGRADQQVQNAKPAAAEKSRKTRDLRKQLADQAEKSTAKTGDQYNTAENIRERNRTLDRENEKARAANEAARRKAGLSPPPEPRPRTTSATPADDDKGPAKGTGDEPENRKGREARTARGAQDDGEPASKAKANTRQGASRNSEWKITEERDGDRRTTTATSRTRNEDGSSRQRTTAKATQRTQGGGKLTTKNREVKEQGADGSSKDRSRRTAGYQGRKGGASTTTNKETERDADGRVTRQSDSETRTTTRNGRGGRTTRTTGTSSTSEENTSWLPGSIKGPTKTDTRSHSSERDRDGRKTTTGHTTTTRSDEWGGKKIVTTTQTSTSSDESRDDAGRKTKSTTTTTTTDKPWSRSRSTEGVFEKDLRPGGDPNEPKEGERVGDPTKFNVKIAGGKLFDPVDEANNTTATSGAGKTAGGTEYGYDAKVQTGQYGAAGTWEVTANKRGLHAKAELSGEVNAVKATATGAVEKDLGGGATAGAKVTATAKVGAEGKAAVEGHLGSDRVAASAEAKAFVGGKAEAAAEASLSWWGLKLTGKAQGEVSVGAGGEVKMDADLSWTKIRLGGKIAATLGLGAGGSTSVELDATEAITGYDLAALDRQFQAGDAIVKICRDLRSGRRRLPPGVKFSDIRRQLQEKADLYAKHPQLSKDGKKISLVDSIVKDLKLVKGKDNAYVTAHHKQRDWYCTNRPQIEAKVVLPSIVERN